MRIKCLEMFTNPALCLSLQDSSSSSFFLRLVYYSLFTDEETWATFILQRNTCCNWYHGGIPTRLNSPESGDLTTPGDMLFHCANSFMWLCWGRWWSIYIKMMSCSSWGNIVAGPLLTYRPGWFFMTWTWVGNEFSIDSMSPHSGEGLWHFRD